MQVAFLSLAVSKQGQVTYDQVKGENLQQLRVGRAGEDLLSFGISIRVNGFCVDSKYVGNFGIRGRSRWIEVYDYILSISFIVLWNGQPRQDI